MRTLTTWIFALVGCVACGPSSAGDTPHLTVYTAGSLARPMRAVLDSFARATNTPFSLESAGSLETARKLTELGKIPDVIALADEEIFPQLLEPDYMTWHVTFATNRIVLARSRNARFANELNRDNWHEILRRPGVQVGHSDPNLDPAGYRTLLVYELAEQRYGIPDLSQALRAATPPRNIRPKEVELVALVQSGELDYAWMYESMTRAASLDFLSLDPQLDLGSVTDSVTYARASVKVQGKEVGDTLVIQGRPIRYALSIPRQAANPALAAKFVNFLLSQDGNRILRGEHLPTLDAPVWTGTGIPPEVR